MKSTLKVLMPDGHWWSVPVMVIAMDRAKHYAKEFGGDVDKSLQEDTEPLFSESDYEIEDWAANNMNWSDVEKHAIKLEAQHAELDMEDGWVNGEKEVI